jgi:hypothetical protein
MDAAAPAPIPAPAGFVRAGVDPFDTVTVPLPSGVAVVVRPARLSAADYLAGKASAFAIVALRARDAWVRAGRMGVAPATVEVAEVVIESIRDVYDVPPEVVDAWLVGIDAPAVHAIAAAAIGATPTPASRERGRAAALVAGGLGGVPLSPIDAASLADWTVNAGRAPMWGG